MSAKLDSLLADRAVFCAVGAGHLAGESGMLTLLKNKGYSIRKVNHTISAIPMPEKNSVMKAKFYEYVNDSVGFKAQFYGKPAEMVKPYEEYQLKLIYQDLGQGNSYCIEIYESSASRSIDDIAMEHLPSPNLSPYKKYLTDSGDEYVEGLADAYPEGVYWSRIVVLENHFLVLKAYGGNKFMNSRRAQRFFDQVSMVD
jgi:hypothetical protein